MPDKKSIYLSLGLITFVVYFFSNPLTGEFYDYTYRIAGALLEGRLGLLEKPPSWLNEIITYEDRYYASFPLGSVLSMLPLAVLQKLGLLQAFPGVILAAATAALCAILFYKISDREEIPLGRRLFLTAFPIFGTWMWANLAFAGAWHIALGLSVAGQLGAIYWTLVRFRPFAAGFCFALAFGNRTEILLIAPIVMYLIYRAAVREAKNPWQAVGWFIFMPIALGTLTLLYNYARFSSITDFGYARIPGVLEEPWYAHGIFSVHAIPGNVYAMLIEPWRAVDHKPYWVPTGFGGSILLNSPFLIYLFRPGARDRTLKGLAWCAIAVLTLSLWCHGNPGGWQISYRYAMDLLPWMFVILLENSPKKISKLEILLLALSIAINAYSTYLFLRSDFMRY
jgi:hypothetical protein